MIRFFIYLVRAFCAILLAILSMSCQYKIDIKDTAVKELSGNVVTELRNVEAFEGIKVSQGIEVFISQGAERKVEVKTDVSILPLVETNVSNQILQIQLKQKSVWKNISKIQVYITNPTYTKIETSSGSSVTSKNDIVGAKISLSSSSGSTIEIALEQEEVLAESSSGSQIEISGKALHLQTDSSSGSEIDAKNLYVNEVDAEASSGSSQKVHPALWLKAKASSGSSVNYYKKPTNIEIKESSGGSIRERKG